MVSISCYTDQVPYPKSNGLLLWSIWHQQYCELELRHKLSCEEMNDAATGEGGYGDHTPSFS